MNKPYADESPMDSVGPLLILLVAAVALVLAAIAALDHLWDLEGAPNPGHEVRTVEKASALETAPQPALVEYLAEKQRLLDGYGWLDSKQGLARIPIEAAIQALTAQSALPPDRRQAYLMGVDAVQPGAAATQAPHAGKSDQVDSPQKGGSQ